MNKLLNCLIVALLSLMTCQPSLANTSRGFYLGADVGYGNTHYRSLELDHNFRLTNLQKSGLAPRIVLGYALYQYIGLELSVIYFQKLLFGPDNFTSDVTSKNKQNLVYVAGKFSIPVWRQLFVYLNAGVGYAVRDDSMYKRKVVLSEPKQYIVTPVYGLGFNYYLTSHWIIDLVWVGAAPRSADQLPVSNFYGIGAAYKF